MIGGARRWLVAALAAGALVLGGWRAMAEATPAEQWTWGTVAGADQRRAMVDAENAAIARRDFAALETMATLYRTGAAPAIDGGSLLPAFYDELVYELRLDRPEGSCAKTWQPFLDAWHAAVPVSGTAALVEAELLRERAWCLRGADKAADVKAENWAPFRAGLAAAESLLEANAARAGDDPQYAVQRARLALEQGRSPAERQRLLDEATAHYPYYYRLYYEAFRGVQPQWGGSLAAVDAAARYAVARTAARDGESTYFRFYRNMLSCGCYDELAAADRPLLRAAMADMAERHPDDWTLLGIVQLSRLLGEKEMAQTYFGRLRVNEPSAWAKAQWTQCRALVGPSALPAPVAQMHDWPWPDIITRSAPPS